MSKRFDTARGHKLADFFAASVRHRSQDGAEPLSHSSTPAGMRSRSSSPISSRLSGGRQHSSQPSSPISPTVESSVKKKTENIPRFKTGGHIFSGRSRTCAGLPHREVPCYWPGPLRHHNERDAYLHEKCLKCLPPLIPISVSWAPLLTTKSIK